MAIGKIILQTEKPSISSVGVVESWGLSYRDQPQLYLRFTHVRIRLVHIQYMPQNPSSTNCGTKFSDLVLLEERL
jgi:hypothetical protein